MTTPLIRAIEDMPLDAKTKGIPLVTGKVRLGDIASKGWNVLRGDMMLPLLVLRDENLRNNLVTMRNYAAHHNVSLAPHGKSSFCPQLYLEQVEVGGSWGITAATVQQASLVAEAGVENIVIANEVIGRANVRQLAALKRAFPDVFIVSLVDSLETIDELRRHGADALDPGERFQVMIEVGIDGGRAGVRTFAQAETLIDALMRQSDVFEFCGVECYEGLVARDTYEATMRDVDRLLDLTVDVLHDAHAKGAFAGREETILTAGGSAYYDRVIDRFKRARNVPGLRIVLRGGSCLTYDHGFYDGHLRNMDRRSGFETAEGVRSARETFTPALEMFAAVVSLQDPGVAVLNMGIRDLPFDLGLPMPLRQYRDGVEIGSLNGPRPDYTIVKSNDQHCYLSYPEGADIRVGDLFACGISHPCTAFDKWKLVYRVDEEMNVTGAVHTFF